MGIVVHDAEVVVASKENSMRKSFYTWLMTQRNPKSQSPVALLADLVFYEMDFPKQSIEFDEVSRFLEERASFSFPMSDFDRIWEEYLNH